MMLLGTNYYIWTPRDTYLHNVRLCTGSWTLRFADEVGLWVCAAQTLVSCPQAPIAVWCTKAHAVTLLPCEISRCRRGEDNKLAPTPISTAAVLETSRIVQTWNRGTDARRSRFKPKEEVGCWMLYIINVWPCYQKVYIMPYNQSFDLTHKKNQN